MLLMGEAWLPVSQTGLPQGPHGLWGDLNHYISPFLTMRDNMLYNSFAYTVNSRQASRGEMRMTMPRVQTSDLPILPFLYRFSLVRVVMNAITTVFVLQVITVIVLEAVAARRKRQKQGKGFP